MLSFFVFSGLALLVIAVFLWAWRRSKNLREVEAPREADALARVQAGGDPFSAPNGGAPANTGETMFAGLPSRLVPQGRIDVLEAEVVDIDQLLAGEPLAVASRARARLEEPTNIITESDTLPPRPAAVAPHPVAAPPPVADSWAARAGAQESAKLPFAVVANVDAPPVNSAATAAQVNHALARQAAAKQVAERVLATQGKAAKQAATKKAAADEAAAKQAAARQLAAAQAAAIEAAARQEAAKAAAAAAASAVAARKAAAEIEAASIAAAQQAEAKLAAAAAAKEAAARALAARDAAAAAARAAAEQLEAAKLAQQKELEQREAQQRAAARAEREDADRRETQRHEAELAAVRESERQEAEQQEAALRLAEQQTAERRQAELRADLARAAEQARVAELRAAAQDAEAAKQVDLAASRAAEREPSLPAKRVATDDSPDRKLPLRELALAWFEARGYRGSPASAAVRPIELVLRHKDDPARAYAFVVECERVSADRVLELRTQAKAIGLGRVLIVADAGADPDALEVMRKKGVRLMDRAALDREFGELDFSIAAKIIAIARKRAALVSPVSAAA